MQTIELLSCLQGVLRIEIQFLWLDEVLSSVHSTAGRGDGESERRGEGIREILVLFLLHLTFTCILIFFYMYEGFACMYMCAPCTCLIPMDTKEGIISPCTRDC